MKLEFQEKGNGGQFFFASLQSAVTSEWLEDDDFFKILWPNKGLREVIIDGNQITLAPNQLLFCTPENILELPENAIELNGYFFNKNFYSKQNQDHCVTGDGVLFYGLENPPLVELPDYEQKVMDAVHLLVLDEFQQKDLTQGEMLLTLLKRILTTAARLLQSNQGQDQWSQKQVNLVKEFNLLVELHFKEKHQVAHYAALLSKSPKTLSNIFKKYGIASPLKIINDRILLEAKRLLKFSELSAEEIGKELGYSESSHFSKFFKKQTGTSPLNFRKET